MAWPDNKLQPVERYLFQGQNVRIGKFDCDSNHPSFPVTESVADNMFVFTTRPVWIRRQTRSFRYVAPGSMLLHTAGCLLERKREDSQRDRTYWFSVTPQVFDEALRTHGLSASVPRLAIAPGPGIQLEVAAMLGDLARNQVTELGVETRVLMLLDSVLHLSSNTTKVDNKLLVRRDARAKARRLSERARAYIDGNIAAPIDLASIARHVGVSSYYLCRLFRSECGITVNEYKVRQRLVRVLEKLAEGHAGNLARLALDTGFSSHSHLTRCFSRQYGLSPSSLRRRAGRSRYTNRSIPGGSR